MSNNTKIFSEAIAEAKAIRETAMANAKLALEEAFAPRIQEMMSDKLEALAEEDEMEEGYEKEMEEGNMENMDEISLEELLSELEGLEEGEKEEMEEGKEEIDENTIAEAEADDEVGEITVDELKDIIRDIMADVMGGGEEEMEAGEEEMEAGEEEMEAGEDDLELEEILAEIASLDEENLDEMSGTSMREPSSSAAAGADQIVNMVKSAIKSSPAMASKIMKALQDAGVASGAAMRNEADNSELEEAMNAIATLRSELNEVNLLNAKLLYVNKLFKAKNLNEAQKVKVINAFDRAETVREAKNVFDTLNESLSTEKVKSQIKESLSFASKAAGVSDRQPIMEGNDFVARMQKLAGII
jgi:hypothetical protein